MTCHEQSIMQKLGVRHKFLENIGKVLILSKFFDIIIMEFYK